MGQTIEFKKLLSEYLYLISNKKEIANKINRFEKIIENGEWEYDYVFEDGTTLNIKIIGSE